MPSKSKTKGNSAERVISDHLTTVFGFNHQRVPNSGAFTSFSNAFRLKQLTPAQQLLYVGDIIVPEQCSHLSYEIKSYADIPFHALFTNCKLLDTWIEQAKEGGRRWFLVMKANNKGFYVCFDSKHGADYIKPENYMNYKGCIVVKLENFFELNKNVLLNLNKRPLSYSNVTTTLSA